VVNFDGADVVSSHDHPHADFGHVEETLGELIRHANPITIHDADHPIGTHIYTVLDYANDGADLRWSAVSMDSRQLGQSGRHTAEPMAPVLGPAREALADLLEGPAGHSSG
jgi:hypothetical protein